MRSVRNRLAGSSGVLRASLLTVLAGGLAALLAACGGSSSSNSVNAADTGVASHCPKLNLYLWEGEAPADLIKPFEEKYGVKTSVGYITSGAESVAKMVAGGNKQYAVILDAPEAVQPMQEAGVIKPIDVSKLPEYDKLLGFTTEAFNIHKQSWALAVDWGVNPLIYSTQVLKTAPTSWSVLWSPQMKGQVSLWEDYSMLFIGATVLGYDKHPNELFNLSKSQLEAIKNKMLELKGNVRTVWNNGGDLIQLFSTHEVGAAQGWSYIYNQLKAKNEPVATADLKDMGAQGWVEGAAISNAVSPDCEAAAYDFLNWLVSPKGAAAFAESSGYTPSNPGAAQYLSPALVKQLGLNDPHAYLGSAILKLAVNNPQAYNQTMEEVIAGLK